MTSLEAGAHPVMPAKAGIHAEFPLKAMNAGRLGLHYDERSVRYALRRSDEQPRGARDPAPDPQGLQILQEIRAESTGLLRAI